VFVGLFGRWTVRTIDFDICEKAVTYPFYYFRIRARDNYDQEDHSRIYKVKVKSSAPAVSLASVPLTLDSPSSFEDLKLDLSKDEDSQETRDKKSYSAEASKDEQETNNSQNSNSNDQKTNEPINQLTNKLSRFFTTRIFKQDGKKKLAEVKFQFIDQKDAPIPNLPVTIHSEPQSQTTDQNGIATFQNIEIGSHTLAFNHEGEKFQKKITLQEPLTEEGEIRGEIYVIKAVHDRSMPLWGWLLVGALSVGLVVSLLVKRKKAAQLS
jgi:hypothetical protein